MTDDTTANAYTDQVAAEAVQMADHHADQVAAASGRAAVSESKDYTDHVAHGLQSQITENKRAIKRLGASSQAVANLHYNGAHSGYAVAVGQYASESALAGGLQFQVTGYSAISVQTSYDAAHVGGSVGLHGKKTSGESIRANATRRTNCYGGPYSATCTTY